MSIINKIMFRGWNRPDGFPREQIERELEPREHTKVSLKRHTKQCKRNHGKPHEFDVVKESYFEWSGSTYQFLKCRRCGKLDMKRKKTDA